jgi:prepilin-type N-terminal cleavage/methylation domain-containing protein
MRARGSNARTSGVSHLCGQIPERNAGVTLLELLIVLLILSIVAMVGMPLIGSAAREARLSRATSDVVSALEYARACASSARTDVCVRFSKDTGFVVVERLVPAIDLLGGDILIPESLVEQGVFESVPHPLEKRTNAFAFISRDAGSPTIESADFGGTNAVIFQAQGAPSSGGMVKLVLGTLKQTVSVDGVTGQISVGE